MKKTLNKAKYVLSFLFIGASTPLIAQEVLADEMEPVDDLEPAVQEISQSEESEEILGTTEYIEEDSDVEIEVVDQTAETPADQNEQASASINYEAHVATIGDMPAVSTDDVESYVGTVGQSHPMEALQIHLDSTYEGSVEYRAHVANEGWQSAVSTEDAQSYAGTKGKSLAMEAIQIALKGEIADYYDIYYRAHVANVGWIGWASNGQSAGSQGYGYGLEALQIKLVEKGGQAPASEQEAFVVNQLRAQAHVATIGWVSETGESTIIGSTGQGNAMEAVKLQLVNQQYTGGIMIKSLVAGDGWEADWKSDGTMSGTTGQSKPIDAVQIALYGEMANHYNIYYRAHLSNIGWLSWTSNGEKAGSELGNHLEAININLVEKNAQGPETAGAAFIEDHNFLSYESHSESGWQTAVKEREMSGSVGQSIALDGLKISLVNAPVEGGVTYRAHVAKIGWQEEWEADGNAAGVIDDDKAIEAIEIVLTGEMGEKYDILYRVHSANIGWLGWARNGESAGSEGYGNAIEAIEIRIYDKNLNMNLGGEPFKKSHGSDPLGAYDWIAGNFHASNDIAVNNAMCVWRFFKARGWSLQAVCGMLGNMQEESGVNPGMWQSLRGPGYGLVQWTPAYEVTSFLEARGLPIDSGDGQCECLQWEMENEINWYNYGMSFHDYSVSQLDPGTLAYYFHECYERGAGYSSVRETNAMNWFYMLMPYA
ncbi:MAG: hypothetical protein J6E46_11850 [Faecalicoccus sp.]|nr:hypothetical protein [Faecalicoccus sp.]